jgi:hypothetical protein
VAIQSPLQPLEAVADDDIRIEIVDALRAILLRDVLEREPFTAVQISTRRCGKIQVRTPSIGRSRISMIESIVAVVAA